MRGRSAVIGIVGVALSLAAIFDCVGKDPDTVAAGSDGGPSITDGGVVITDEAGNSCLCLPTVPTGWEGPIVVDELADCIAPWSAGTAIHSDLDGGVAECTCACTAQPGSCALSTTNGTVCGNLCSDTPLVQGACNNYGSSCNVRRRVEVLDAGGPCVPAPTEVIPPPTWARNAKLCRPDAPPKTGVCPNAADPCAPAAPASGAHCIVHAGDLPCPPTYGTRRVYHDGLEDTRQCTACTCSEDGGPCHVEEYDDAGCTGVVGAVSTANCGVKPASAGFFKLVRAGRGCTPNGGALTGALQATGQQTVCCR